MPLLKGTYNMHLYPNAIGKCHRLVKTQLENSNCEKPGGVNLCGSAPENLNTSV